MLTGAAVNSARLWGNVPNRSQTPNNTMKAAKRSRKNAPARHDSAVGDARSTAAKFSNMRKVRPQMRRPPASMQGSVRVFSS